LDCSAGAKQGYLEKHIPGAIWLDFENFFDKENPLPNMLPTKEQTHQHLTAIKVGASKPLVLYDN